MSEELFVFERSPENDPRGSKLRGVLTAHFALEAALARRLVLGWSFVVASIVGAILLARPPASPFLRTLALFAWLVTGFGALAAARSARRWRRRRAELAGVAGSSHAADPDPDRR